MNLTAMLVDREELIPIEIFWAGREIDFISKSIRMLEQGALLAQGRTLLMDDSPFQSGLGKVSDIPVESWLDADKDYLDSLSSNDKKLQLHGPHTEDVIVEIKLHNSPQLREFVGFDVPSISVDEYDERFFKNTNTKMGAKVWARAAAALALEEVEPTGRKLAAHLLSQSDIWKNGKIEERNLQRHLSPLVEEFKKKLTGSP